MAKTLKEKLEHFKKEIAKAEAEGDEEYLKYITNIERQTIHVYAGAQFIFQSGNPKPPPPYGGG